MRIKLLTQSQIRQYNVSNAVAPIQIEGIAPTKVLEQNYHHLAT